MSTAQIFYFYLTTFTTTAICVALLLLYLRKNKDYKSLLNQTKEHEITLKRQLYENTVLQKISARFGYSLNIQRVIDTVISSLSNLVNYSTVSYILVESDKVIFKTHIVDSVSRAYIDEIQNIMYKIYEEEAKKEVGDKHLEETLLGNILDSYNETLVESSFNIPLVMNGNVVGIFNISSINKNAFKSADTTLLYKIIGKATSAVSTLHDFLDQERGKLESMVSSMDEGIVMIDSDFRLMLVNPACLELLGIKHIKDSAENVDIYSNKIQSTSIFEIVGAFDKKLQIEKLLAHVFETGEQRKLSGVRIGKSYLQVVFFPVAMSATKKGVGILITDQSEEWKLKQLREEFTAMLVHELRSPLTVILGTSDLMLKQFEHLSKDQSTVLLNQINNSTSNLLDIVNDLLDNARVESGKFKLVKKSADLNQLLKEEVDYYSRLAQKKELHLELCTDELIEKFDFDKNKISQVMNNLLSNAIKYTPLGTVKVESKLIGEYVQVSVSDSGEGVPDKMKPMLFTKFVRVNEDSHQDTKGTGLGLAITKAIVEGHGGKIWVVDNSPSGAKFIFTLPYTPVAGASLNNEVELR